MAREDRTISQNREKVLPVKTSMETADAFDGDARGERRVPGPFAVLETGRIYELDPRKRK